MKSIFFKVIALYFVCISFSFAQYDVENLKISYGEELPDDKQKIIKILGEDKGLIYALALKKDDYFIKIFESGSMKMKTSKQIVFTNLDGKDIDFEDAYLLNGQPYVIGCVYIRKNKQFNLVASKVGTDGKVSADGIRLFSIDVKNKSERGNFYIKDSNDESSLAVLHTVKDSKMDAIKYELKLFDDQLKTLFSTKDQVNFEDDNKKDFEFNISDFAVNDKKDLMIVVNEAYRDKKNKNHIENFELQIFKSSNNYQKEIVNIDVKGKEIINCKLYAGSENSIKLLGFYSALRSNGKSFKELKGIFNGTVNLETVKVEGVKFNEFDMQTKIKLLGERRANKGNDLKPYYSIISVIHKEDGGTIVLSEFSIIRSSRGSGIGPLTTTTVNFDFNEIIVNSFSADGALQWSNVVPKEQNVSVTSIGLNISAGTGNGNFGVGISATIPLGMLGSGPEYISAIPFYHNKKLSILINDNIKNKGITDINKISKLGNHLKAVPSLFVFDENGNVTRKDPEAAIKNELVIRPGVYYNIDNLNYIIYASRKKLDRLGRLNLQQ